MTDLAFDTLKYAKRLEAAGFTVKQAEALAEEQARLFSEQLATKLDLEQLHADVQKDLHLMEQRITIRLGGMIVVGVGILVALNVFS